MKRKIVCSAVLTLLWSGVAGWADEAPKADNSAQNKGALEKDSVTAEKQDNKKSDLNVLKAVRKTVVDDSGLSSNAKNVKILFSKGIVTLRGPVESVAEKSRLEELAKATGGVTAVKNLVTVAKKAH